MICWIKSGILLFQDGTKMKVTLNWLKQYVDFDWSPEELTGRVSACLQRVLG
jgi:hypothetical protein